jgi:hypothetical protein
MTNQTQPATAPHPEPTEAAAAHTQETADDAGIKETIGEYEVVYVPALELATATRRGLLVPEVVHTEDGPDAFEKCKAWARGGADPASPELIQAGRQLTKNEAVRLFESKFWEGMEAYDIALFQSFQERLCMPYGIYHAAVEESLGRPVMVHEYKPCPAIQEELLGLRPAPSLADILNLIPEEKRVVINLEGGQQ